ncbi:MAG: hypothetical protein IT371_17160 [Deltaproteobacteria bacterium]|nr:hypothetical protein [Deltaproteobacteria bacterium]
MHVLSPRLRAALAGTIALTAVPLLGLTEQELLTRRLSGLSRAGEAYYLPPPGLLRALSFGYNEVAADLVWVRSIAYFADHLVTDRDLRHLQRYLDTVLALDDRFKEVYRYGSSMLMSRGERQTNEDVWAAISLLKRANALYPGDYRFAMHLGAYYMSDLRTRSKEQRAAWRREGADWVRRAALIGADIPWLPSLAAKIYSEQGQRELAIRHLQEIYLNSQDPEMKAQIAAKLRGLQAAHLAEELRTQAERFERAHRESGLGFVPPDLFALLELPPLLPFSLRPASEPPASAPAAR